MFSYFFPESVRTQQERCVVVRVWLPKINSSTMRGATDVTAKRAVKAIKAGQEASVGHVSLELPNKELYVSLWPAHGVTGVFKIVQASYKNLRWDKRNEGEPDLIVSLYSLDTNLIAGAFIDVKKGENGYVLLGDKCMVRIANRSTKGQSCCGLVYELLCIGGIRKLDHGWIPWSLDYCLVITPDNFGTFIKQMKNSEVTLCPETLRFPKIENEYNPRPTSTSRCLLQ